jgi:hypothetical protein
MAEDIDMKHLLFFIVFLFFLMSACTIEAPYIDDGQSDSISDAPSAIQTPDSIPTDASDEYENLDSTGDVFNQIKRSLDLIS